MTPAPFFKYTLVSKSNLWEFLSFSDKTISAGPSEFIFKILCIFPHVLYLHYLKKCLNVNTQIKVNIQIISSLLQWFIVWHKWVVQLVCLTHICCQTLYLSNHFIIIKILKCSRKPYNYLSCWRLSPLIKELSNK